MYICFKYWKKLNTLNLYLKFQLYINYIVILLVLNIEKKYYCYVIIEYVMYMYVKYKICLINWFIFVLNIENKYKFLYQI